MTHSSATAAGADISPRTVALIAGLGLLVMAVLAPVAHFGVLQNLIQPDDATATVANIIESEALFRIAVAALLVVTFLDILVAWALYVLFRPVNATLATLVGWLRLAAAAAFLPAVANLLDVAQLLGGPSAAAAPTAATGAQVMLSVASFENGWDIMLAVFGLHLVGLGALVYRSTHFPRILGALVVIAGVGYLGDTFTRILVPDFDFTFSLFTFIGEALLIVWFLWRAVTGFADEPAFGGERTAGPPQPDAVVS